MPLKSKAFWSLEAPLSKEPPAIPEWDLPWLQLFVDIDVFLQLLISRARPRSISSGRWVPKSLRSEEHTSELQSRGHLVCRLLLEKKKKRETRHEINSTSIQ